MDKAITLHREGFDPSQVESSILALYNKENTGNVKRVIQSTIEMHDSLILSIDECGGSGWPWIELKDMTILTLFSNLATNGVPILFCHDSKKDKSK